MSQVSTAVRTLLVTDLVDSTRLIERLGDARAARIFERYDRLARNLLDRHRGREIDKTDGFLALFDRPIHAVSYALAHHEALERLEAEMGVPLRARAAVHLGEVILRENPPEEVARGAKPLEVEGIAKPVAARLMALAGAGQTLLSRGAFDVARRAASDDPAFADQLRWLAHGPYLLKGIEDPVEVFEVGIEGHAPLVAPTPSDKARRIATEGTLLGWRPAPGLDVPHRPHWVFEKKLGEGGFGEVWLARHRKTRDPRVLKFCFELERVRALQREVTLCRVLRESLGNRPDISRILDWNFEEPPYFLELEYTEGGNLLEWVVAQGGFSSVPLSLRLELVAQVADAVAAAHSVGVLHKDIKPANVLVSTTADGTPRVQVTDFGIGALTDRTRLEGLGITAMGMTQTATGAGTSASGTRIYMAPEILEGKPATMQADVYALGVLAYQMVVGNLARALAPGWEREVSDDVLREDVAAFVEGKPELRVPSAAEVARRLRTVSGRREERRAEAARRREADEVRGALARSRRRWRVAAAAGVVALAVAAVTGLQARRVAREAERANREAAVAKRVTDFLVSLFRVSDPSEARGSSVTAREILDRGAERIDAELRDQPLVRAELMDVMGTVYLQIGLLEPSARLLGGSLRIREAALGGGHLDTAESQEHLGSLLVAQGKLDLAASAYKEALRIRQETLGEEHPLVAASLNRIAWLHQERGELDAARSVQKQAVAILERTEPEGEEMRQSLYTLAGIHFQQAEPGPAKALLERTLAIEEKLHGKGSREAAGNLNDIGVMCRELGQLDEAERAYLQALALQVRYLGPDHADLASLYNNLAAVLSDRGDAASAETFHRKALALRDAALGTGHPMTAISLNNTGYVVYASGRPRDAMPYLLQALATRETTLPGHPQLAVTLANLGLCHLELGELDAAEVELCRSLDVRERVLRPDHPDMLTSLEGLAATMQAASRPDEAALFHERAGAVRRALAASGAKHPPLPPIRPPAR